MTANSDRAAQLAQIFGWEHNVAIIWPPWNRFGFSHDSIFESGSREFMLEWLLRKINDEEWIVGMGNDADGIFGVTVTIDGKEGNARNEDCLIALVDAVLAAHEGGAK